MHHLAPPCIRASLRRILSCWLVPLPRNPASSYCAGLRGLTNYAEDISIVASVIAHVPPDRHIVVTVHALASIANSVARLAVQSVIATASDCPSHLGGDQLAAQYLCRRILGTNFAIRSGSWMSSISMLRVIWALAAGRTGLCFPRNSFFSLAVHKAEAS
ncbi:hypothetical protein PHLGIDRAFT_194623 [Phlebiopsis gigantea 11061_1 CR5-6]|uniref:Uncharacterized protein n=1 Tax=Phlebiopsis gigantea (strain 11061_1 CR5-6) TaxID=745531 RepID=A0A0C3S706_PHLG1|nr:hypothetical protein PHLGIDRAFT_194623 [Phlebiopsis gigantea 11061_1 CR5-6]